MAEMARRLSAGTSAIELAIMRKNSEKDLLSGFRVSKLYRRSSNTSLPGSMKANYTWQHFIWLVV
jgi:hypothetical protein